MAVKNYDPKKIVVIVGGAPISGFADGSFVDIDEAEDGVKSTSGADGEVGRSISNNPMVTITITLQQTSASNDILSALYAADRATGAGVVPVLIEDLLGTTSFSAGQAWIKKMAKASYSKEISTREWTIEAVASAPLAFFVGGSNS